jgi:hypothetical protein
MLRERCEKAEARGERNRRLLGFAQWGMHLLRDIFEEVRESGSLREAPQSQDDTDARDVLKRIVSLFCSLTPKLGNFSEILVALREALSDNEEVSMRLQDSLAATKLVSEPVSPTAESAPTGDLFDDTEMRLAAAPASSFENLESPSEVIQKQENLESSSELTALEYTTTSRQRDAASEDFGSERD